MKNQPTSIWTIVDRADFSVTHTAELFRWSTNYDARTGTPWMFFLDLIGFSDDAYGERFDRDPSKVLGYLELSYLADALGEYALHPDQVWQFVETLMGAEE